MFHTHVFAIGRTKTVNRGSKLQRLTASADYRVQRSCSVLRRIAVGLFWCIALAILVCIRMPLAVAADYLDTHADRAREVPHLIRVQSGTQAVAPTTDSRIVGAALTTVPNVEGLSLSQAVEQLRQNHLVYLPFGETAGQEYNDRIALQNPKPGARVRWNTPVRLTRQPVVARTVTVPPIVGLTPEAARARLEAVGLSLGSYAGSDSNGAAQTVALQDPRAGALAPVGSTVNVRVRVQPSQASEPSQASQPTQASQPATPQVDHVPRVIGLSLDSARSYVEAAGLNFVPDVSDGAEQTRQVVRQRPAPGASVPPGTTVRVYTEVTQGSVANPTISPASASTVTPSIEPVSPEPWLTRGQEKALTGVAAGGAFLGGLLWLIKRILGRRETTRKPKPPPVETDHTPSKALIVQVTLTCGPGNHAFRKAPGLACPAVNVRLDWLRPDARIVEPRDPTHHLER
jgi:beta-lactam-binding protein with PASTA domain